MKIKNIKPGVNVRNEMIEFLIKECLEVSEKSEKTIAKDEGVLLNHYLPSRRVPQIASVCRSIALEQMRLAISGNITSHAATQNYYRRSFSLLYWATELHKHHIMLNSVPWDAPNPMVTDVLAWHGLSITGGAEQYADWVAPYLYCLMKGGAAETDFIVDETYMNFMLACMESQIKCVWPSDVNEKKFGMFAPLLKEANNANSFKKGIVDYCDHRLANCLGYDSIKATRRRGDKMGSVFDFGSWNRYIPTEFSSLRYAYKKCYVDELSLDADHPLLRSTLNKVPGLLPLYEDKFTTMLQSLGEEVYGIDWKPLTPVLL